MPILAKEKATLVEQFPGKTIEGSTTFADLCPDVTIDEILADLNKDGTPVDSEEEGDANDEEDSDEDESEETESDEEPIEEEPIEEGELEPDDDETIEVETPKPTIAN
jgi:hypothetical protein